MVRFLGTTLQGIQGLPDGFFGGRYGVTKFVLCFLAGDNGIGREFLRNESGDERFFACYS